MKVIVVDNPFVALMLKVLLGGGVDGPIKDFLKKAGTVDLKTAMPDLKTNPDFYLKPEVPKALVLKVRSNTDPTKFYNVTQDRQGNMYCTCPGFKYRGKCRHIDKVNIALEQRLVGLGMCLTCDHFNRNEALIGVKPWNAACSSMYTLVCPPHGGCRHFHSIPRGKARYTSTYTSKEMPMTFPVEGALLQTFQSRHFPEVQYEVKLKDGNMVCTCRGFQFHGNCKHTQHMRGKVNQGVVSL